MHGICHLQHGELNGRQDRLHGLLVRLPVEGRKYRESDCAWDARLARLYCTENIGAKELED